MTVEVVAAGGVIRDCVVASDGEVSLDRMGGNAVYAAVGARPWCRGVGLVGNVPANYPSEWLDALDAHGISTTGVRRMEVAAEEPEWFFYREDGERLDQLHAPPDIFRAAGFGEGRLSPQDVERWRSLLSDRTPSGLTFAAFRRAHPVSPAQAAGMMEGVRGLHLSAEGFDAQLALAKVFRERGATISLDPGSAALRRPLREWAPLLALVDAFLPSRRELAALVPGLPPREALAVLAERTTCHLAVKLGAVGALVWSRERRGAVHVPAVPVRAVDPTGAGDAFCGGFLAGLLETGNAALAACRGTVSASLAVEHFGALGPLGAHPSLPRSRLRALAGQVLEPAT